MTQPQHQYYPEDQADKMTAAFVKVAESLNGLTPQQGLEVLSKAAGRLLASAVNTEEARADAFQRMGDAVAHHMHQFMPYVTAYREFKDVRPNADTVKN